jgi:hypothetical protein
LEAANTDLVQLFDKEYAEAVRADEPDNEADGDEAQVGAPVGKSVIAMYHNPPTWAGTKKAASFEAASRPTLARGSWPPESPAKPYLKVSCNS